MAAPFKAYDVRGIYGDDVTEALAYQVGRAYAAFTGARRVIVGRDMRDSGPSLSAALMKGLNEAGVDVVDIGLCSTDMMYFAVIDRKTDGGIMVTASHNPAQYQGLKCVREKAIPMGLGSGLEAIEARVRSGDLGQPSATPGTITQIDVLDDFIAFMHSFVPPESLKPLKVVIDAGNGMGGLILPKLFEKTAIEVTPLFYELDGTFPNHEANPLIEENRRDMVAKVKEIGADLGIGLDGDTDRAFFVDADGTFISGDFIVGLLAQPVLAAHPGALIVYDVRCSNYVKDTVARLGGRTKMWQVGHAPAKNFMREHKAEFGGEVSGHYYFRHHDAYFDSGNLTALLLLKTLSDKGVGLKEAMKETADYHISGEINSVVQDPQGALAKIEAAFGPRGEILRIDGISIVGVTGWWVNVRISNTEPLVRLNCEAESAEAMEKLRDEALAIIRS
ncbi:MAG: phosphomannomutase/phosphoglucomutase [Candidatus Sericytochromatia bacterium]|nr:phosphomannomutase/phosphoglucomutase [Candidatus Sericytochromatia bacterium]